MRITAPKLLSAVLAILLVLLLAAGLWTRWTVDRAQPARDAQRQAAAHIKTLRVQVESSGAEEVRARQLEEDLDAQLAALPADTVDEAQAEDAGKVGDLTALGAAYDDSARALLDLAGTPSLDAEAATTLTSVAVGHWLSARQLTGRLARAAEPGSAEDRALTDFAGLSAQQALETQGTCPASSAEGMVRGLDEARWAESFFLGRASADGLSTDLVRRLGDAQSGHTDQLEQLREGLGTDCGNVPEPRAGYLPAQTDPAASLTAQSRDLAGNSLEMVRAQREAQRGTGDGSTSDDDGASASPSMSGNGAWLAWSVRSLALNAALEASADEDAPALPGTR